MKTAATTFLIAALVLLGSYAIGNGSCTIGTFGGKAVYIFAIDITGSMEGKVDRRARNVFPELKRLLTNEYADAIPAGSKVWVVPFGEGVVKSKIRTFTFPEQRAEYEQYVNALRATESNTYIYRSLVQIYEDLIPASDNSNLPTRTYLFTDGLDNDRQSSYYISKLEHIARGFDSCQNNSIFIISLNPNNSDYENPAPDVIRVVSPKNNEVPFVRTITIKPQTLNFGNLWDKSDDAQKVARATKSIALFVTGDKPVKLSTVVDDDQVSSSGAFVTVSPSSIPISSSGVHQLDLTLTVHNIDDLRQGEYSAILKLVPPDNAGSEYVSIIPDSINLKFSYAEPTSFSITPASESAKASVITVSSTNEPSVDLKYVIKIVGYAPHPIKALVELGNIPDYVIPKINGYELNKTELVLKPGEPAFLDVAFAFDLQSAKKPGLITPTLSITDVGGNVRATELTLPTIAPPRKPIPLWVVASVALLLLVAVAAFVIYALLRLQLNVNIVDLNNKPKRDLDKPIGLLLTLQGIFGGIDLGHAENGLAGLVIKLGFDGGIVLEDIPLGMDFTANGRPLSPGEQLSKGILYTISLDDGGKFRIKFY